MHQYTGFSPRYTYPFSRNVMKASAMRGFVLRTHRQIRVFPLPQHAQAFEIPPVLIHVARSEFAAHAPEFPRRDTFPFFRPVLFPPAFRSAARGNPIRERTARESPPSFSTSRPCLSKFYSARCRDGSCRSDTAARHAAQTEAAPRAPAGCGDRVLPLPTPPAASARARATGLHREGRLRQIQRAFQVFDFGHFAGFMCLSRRSLC